MLDMNILTCFWPLSVAYLNLLMLLRVMESPRKSVLHIALAVLASELPTGSAS